MRLTETLVRVAALAAAATSGCGTSSGNTEGPPSCREPPSITVTAAQACQILDEDYVNEAMNYPSGRTCSKLCGGAWYFCELPQSFVSTVQSLNSGVTPGTSDGGTRMLDCPTNPSTLMVVCGFPCGGRLTQGYRAPEGTCDEGQRLAAMSYLEAVSVHAFERLASELEVHRAPAQLLRAARRARRDEVRHTTMTARLARERGGSPRLPEAPAPFRARPLVELAIENAVEGCVRETYGAVQGLAEAQTSRDRGIRRAMKEAIAEIAARDPRTASLLFS